MPEKILGIVLFRMFRHGGSLEGVLHCFFNHVAELVIRELSILEIDSVLYEGGNLVYGIHRFQQRDYEETGYGKPVVFFVFRGVDITLLNVIVYHGAGYYSLP